MSKPVSYKRHRFPPEIIAHAVWLYLRRIRICHFADANGRGRAFDLPEGCRGSSTCSLPSTTFSFHPAPAALPVRPTFTASTPWRSGKSRRLSPLEGVKRPNLPQCVQGRL